MILSDETTERYAAAIASKMVEFTRDLTGPDEMTDEEMVHEFYSRLDSDEIEFMACIQVKNLMESVAIDVERAIALGKQLQELQEQNKVVYII